MGLRQKLIRIRTRCRAWYRGEGGKACSTWADCVGWWSPPAREPSSQARQQWRGAPACLRASRADHQPFHPAALLLPSLSFGIKGGNRKAHVHIKSWVNNSGSQVKEGERSHLSLKTAFCCPLYDIKWKDPAQTQILHSPVTTAGKNTSLMKANSK